MPKNKLEAKIALRGDTSLDAGSVVILGDADWYSISCRTVMLVACPDAVSGKLTEVFLLENS